MPTNPPSGNKGDSDLAVALVLYGMLSYVLVLFWAVNIDKLRLRTYQMIGHSLSMFVGVLMFQTLDTIINDLLQGGDDNENSSDIPLSLLSFLLWNLLGLFLISKFRRKPLLQKGSLIIIGHTAGFACINIATIVQTSSFDQNGGMAVLYLLIVLLVLLAGYSIIYFLLELLITAHFAVKHARKRRREDSQITASTSQAAPPMTPETDVPVDEVEVVEVRPKIVYIRHYHRRISESPSATKRCLLKFVGHVIASTMAFITIQAFTFVIYGEYPGVTLRPPQEKAVAELYMWLVALSSAALVLVINLVAANKKAKYWLTRETWWGDIIFDAFHKFIHLCLAWSLLLASYWLLAEIYDPGTSESIWALTNSIVYSIVSILVVWLLSEAEQRFRVAPVIVEGFVWAISLLLGYSWKLVFTEAQNAVMDTDRWGLRILTSVMNFGLMVPVYFRYILPKMDPPSPVIDQEAQTSDWIILRSRSALW